LDLVAIGMALACGPITNGISPSPSNCTSFSTESTSVSTSWHLDAGSEPPGLVTVQSVDPLAGEILLDTLMDESGNPQTIRAGFKCGW